MRLIKLLWYGMFINYHLMKGKKVGTNYKVVWLFHYEMAKHYYEKATGKKLKRSI